MIKETLATMAIALVTTLAFTPVSVAASPAKNVAYVQLADDSSSTAPGSATDNNTGGDNSTMPASGSDDNSSQDNGASSGDNGTGSSGDNGSSGSDDNSSNSDQNSSE